MNYGNLFIFFVIKNFFSVQIVFSETNLLNNIMIMSIEYPILKKKNKWNNENKILLLFTKNKHTTTTTHIHIQHDKLTIK